MKKRLSVLVLVLCLLCSLLPTAAYAASDSDVPKLESITFSSTHVTSPGSLEITVKTACGYNVRYVEISIGDSFTTKGFRLIGAESYHDIRTGENIRNGKNGEYTITLKIGEDVPPGTYMITSVLVHPGHGSTLDYRRAPSVLNGWRMPDDILDLYFTVDDPNLGGVTRIQGKDRYDTSFKTADALKKVMGIDKFQNIIVASGTGFADALGGSFLADCKDAPILLVRQQNVGDVKDYIRRNLMPGGTVYLLGGENAVPKAMESGLNGFRVKRLGGKDRYETNLRILEEVEVGYRAVFVCTGKDFADSLSASAKANPILLVKDSLTSDQKIFLKKNASAMVIVGGTNAVSQAIEAQLKDFGSVKRVAGANRFETSARVAELTNSQYRAAVLAYAYNFPDGLCGGPLAARLGAPLLLTATGHEYDAYALADDMGIRYGFILGGPGLISDQSVRTILSMNRDRDIVVK